jgi:FkbM family methyltransferase
MSEVDRLANALRIIGRDERVRRVLTRVLRRVEATQANEGSIRDEVTGPLVDALFADAGLVRKKLQSGLVIDFYPSSKITRDFILSTPAVPDHVWEPQTTRLLLHLARGTRHVVIGGAYFGDHALLIAQQLQAGGGVVHAFEPNATNVKLLAHNARTNALDNIRAHRLGLWDRPAKLKLLGEDALATSEEIVEGESVQGAFETVTIDEYRKQLDAGIGLIMLDIEGGEMRALRGAHAQLALPGAQAPHVVFEVHSSYVDWSSGLEKTTIVEYMQSLGYHVYAVRDCWSNRDLRGQPIEVIPAKDTYIEGPPHGFNMLAVKDPAMLGGALFRIRHHVSPKYLFHKDPALHHPLKD